MAFYVSNKNESIRLFKNPVLEWFSHIHPAVPLAVYVPVVAYFFYRAAQIAIWWQNSFAFVGGLFAWTLLEYLLHRFVFHFHPTSKLGKQLLFLFHGIHHDYPRDATRLVMPLPVSVPLAFLFYAAFSVFGTFQAAAYAGLVTGYLCYDMIHYATHHFRMRSKIGQYLKNYHVRHHYQDPENGFGVSNPLWDYVFGTRMDLNCKMQINETELPAKKVA